MASAGSPTGLVISTLLLVVDDGALAFVLMMKSMHSSSTSLGKVHETLTVPLLQNIEISVHGSCYMYCYFILCEVFTLDKIKKALGSEMDTLD